MSTVFPARLREDLQHDEDPGRAAVRRVPCPASNSRRAADLS